MLNTLRKQLKIYFFLSFIIALLYPLTNKAYGLSKFDSSAVIAIGQTDLDSCYRSGLDTRRNYSTSLSVNLTDSGKLIVTDGGYRVLLYNTIPTSSYSFPDVSIGSLSTCSAVDGYTARKISVIYDTYFDGSKLFVADAFNNRVLIYNSLPTSSNSPADVVVGQASFTANLANQGGSPNTNTLNGPRGVFSDGTKLYISDTSNNRVLIYNVIPTTNNASADVVVGQVGFTTNSANLGGRNANTLSAPRGLSVDDQGKLYVADTSNNRVLIFNSVPEANNASADIVVGQANFTSGSANQGISVNANTLNAPQDAIVHDGRLYVADSSNNRVLVFNAIPSTHNTNANVVVGQPVMTQNSANNGGVSASTLNLPLDISIKGSRLAIADKENSRILIFNSLPVTSFPSADVVQGQPDMTTTAAYSKVVPPVPATQNNHVTLSFMKFINNKLFVADSYFHRMLVWNSIPSASSVSPDFALGQPSFLSNTSNFGGITSSSLNFPSSSCTYNGKLVLADSLNHRVLIYNSIPTTFFVPADVVVGQPLFTQNTANNGGRSAKSLNRPYSVSCTNGKLLIVDTGNHRILVFNTIPTVSFTEADLVIGQADFVSGSANRGGAVNAGTLNNPASIDYNGQKLVITDTNNNRVLIYNSIPLVNGASADIVVGQSNFTAASANQGGTISSNTIFGPSDAIFDGSRLLVADTRNTRVLIFNLIPQANNVSADVVVGQTNFSDNYVGNDARKFTLPMTLSVSEDRKLLLVGDWVGRGTIFALGSKNTSVSSANFVNTIELSFTVNSEDAKDMMVSENYNFTGATWQGYTLNSQFTLSSGDGVKEIFVKTRDFADYEGDVVSKQVILDTAAPNGTILIKNGAIKTKDLMNELNLSATDILTPVTQMMMSEDINFSGSGWQLYEETMNFTLSPGDGVKTVYVKYKDAAGNESAPVSDTIFLDTIAPPVRLSSVGLITNVPDKNSLFYYFTSQSPLIRGKSEEHVQVFFKFGDQEYSTSTDAEGNYSIEISGLPRRYVTLEYFAVDSLGNKSEIRQLNLMIGEENFPATSVTLNPTYSEQIGPSIVVRPDSEPKIIEISVINQDDEPLTDAILIINGQRYTINVRGKAYLEKEIPNDAKVQIEIQGKVYEGSIRGTTVSVNFQKATESSKWWNNWWWLLLLVLIVSGLYVIRRSRKKLY